MKRIALIVLCLICIITINNLAHSIYSLWQKKYVVTKAEQQLAQEKQRNIQLKHDLTTVEKPDFVEAEARNKLMMVKPGEQIVILPTPQSVKEVVASQEAVATPSRKQPVWQQWLTVFGFAEDKG